MILDTILYNLKTYPDKICCKHDKFYSNKEFYELVCKIYTLIKDSPKDRPIVVYGHKEAYMIASFLACSFLGITYVPIDKSLNEERINYIIDLVKPSLIIGDLPKCNVTNIISKEINEVNQYEDIQEIEMKPDDTYYIIFTSGSTGNPKGVMVSYKNVDSCVSWLEQITNIVDDNYVIYNQAVFSFDLSVADIYLSLVTNSVHYIGIDFDILNLNEKLLDLKKSNCSMMVLTPSFAELLCTDESFNEKLLPNLNMMMFCGEKLSSKLVRKLYSRFSKIRIINMYGPTECTYAVTSYDVPKECEENISIGTAKDDTKIFIVNDSLKTLNDGEVGEILIAGKSVAKGYLGLNQNDRFIMFNGERAYLTGDLGYYKDNLLYFVSRKDSQIKYKGYRIELEDIKNNIEKISGIKQVKVQAIKNNDDIVQRIEALIVLNKEANEMEIKQLIKNAVPSYMLPRIKIVDQIELGINGKS